MLTKKGSTGRFSTGVTGRNWTGFTLVELLVVIAIIGILVSSSSRQSTLLAKPARAAQCKNNLKQLILALANYEGTHGSYPDGIAGAPGTIAPAWSTYLLPFLELGNEFDQILPDSSEKVIVYRPEIQELVSTSQTSFRCPSSAMEPADPSTLLDRSRTPLRFGTSNYRGCRGIRDNAGSPTGPSLSTRTTSWKRDSNGNNNLEIRQLIGVLYPTHAGRYDKTTKVRQITDGLSHTIAIGETDEVPPIPALGNSAEKWRETGASDDGTRAQRWPTWPGSHGDKDDSLFNAWDPVRSSINSGDRDCASSLHPSGAHFGFCDGSVHYFTESIVWDVYGAFVPVPAPRRFRSKMRSGSQTGWPSAA